MRLNLHQSRWRRFCRFVARCKDQLTFIVPPRSQGRQRLSIATTVFNKLGNNRELKIVYNILEYVARQVARVNLVTPCFRAVFINPAVLCCYSLLADNYCLLFKQI